MTEEMPTWEGFMIPTLRVLSDGVVRHWREFQPLVADDLQLTDAQRKEMLPSGSQVKYENRIGWGVSFLTNVGALDRPKRGHYAITDAGRQILAMFPDGVRERDVQRSGKDPGSPIRLYQKVEHAKAEGLAVLVADDSMTPTEQVQQGVARIDDEVATELLTRLQGKEPGFFEQAVVQLLLAMGYGGTTGSGTVTQLSNDGGIDGVIDQDVLGLSRVYIQAKRYADDNVVGRPDLQGFVGALSRQSGQWCLHHDQSILGGARGLRGCDPGAHHPHRRQAADEPDDPVWRRGPGARHLQGRRDRRGLLRMSRLEELIAELCPDGVDFRPLREVVTEFIVPMRDRPKLFDGDIPWCRIEDVEGLEIQGSKTGLAVSPAVVSEMNLKVVPEGALIASCSASLGTYAIATKPLITNQTFIGLVCGPELLNRFLLFVMFTKTKQLRTAATTGTIAYISRKKFEDLIVPVPPLEVQREIVRILDQFTQLEAKLELELEAELEARRQQYSYYSERLLSHSDTAAVPMVSLGDLLREPLTNGRSVPDGGGYPVLRLTALRGPVVNVRERS